MSQHKRRRHLSVARAIAGVPDDRIARVWAKTNTLPDESKLWLVDVSDGARAAGVQIGEEHVNLRTRIVEQLALIHAAPNEAGRHLAALNDGRAKALVALLETLNGLDR